MHPDGAEPSTWLVRLAPVAVSVAPMSVQDPARPPSTLFRTVAVVLALLLGLVIVSVSAATFFGGTKVRTLFGVSAEALAGQDAGHDGGSR